MHGEPSISIRDDSALLARWAREGNEDAFAEIVRQYQRLVLGVALRRTGDAEMARDVAQQVFATLAAKACMLLGRTNVAGWLYQAASHIGARAMQAETRRRGAHERLAKEPRDAGDAQWPLVEDALARLGEGERESLVLHFFQDLSYPEMARVLSIEEAAARKRVSRALQSLEMQLRRRGLGASATALLTAAVAHQTAIPAQAGLAAAALSAVPTAAPLSIAIATLMSQTTAKILCATPLALEWKANAALRAEITKIRNAHPNIAVPRPDADPLAPRKAELAAKHTARLAAENRVSELLEMKNKVETEVVVSFGSVETMGKKLARIMRLLDSLKAVNYKNPEPGSEADREAVALAGPWAEGVQEMLGLMQEIPRLERDPAKAARFYATCYGEFAELDPSAQTLLEARTRQWLQELRDEGLALPQRPIGIAKEWDTRRDAATKTFFARLAAELPPTKPGRPTLEEAFDLGGGENGPSPYEMLFGGQQP